MLKVREQGVSGTASEHGYPLPPHPRKECVYVLSTHKQPSFHLSHLNLCWSTTTKQTNESLPQPSVALLAAFSSCNSLFPPLLFPAFHRHHHSFLCVKSSIYCLKLSTVDLKMLQFLTLFLVQMIPHNVKTTVFTCKCNVLAVHCLSNKTSVAPMKPNPSEVYI